MLSSPRRSALVFIASLLLALLPVVAAGDEPVENEPDDAPTQAQAAALARLEAAFQHQQGGRMEQAVSGYEEALEQLVDVAAPKAWIARGHHELAACLAALQRHEEALPHARKAVAMRRTIFAGDHAELATSLNNLGIMARSAKRLDEALAALEEALAMRLRVLPERDPELPHAYDSVALTLARLGRPAQALVAFQGGLRLRRLLLSPRDPALVTNLSNLAIMHFRLGRPGEALPLLEEVLTIRRAVHGGDHPDVAAALSNLASAKGALGQQKEALTLKQEALGMSRRLFQGDHERLATDLNNVAMSLADVGRYAEARPLLEDALAMRERLFPGDHPEVAQAHSNLALILNELGRHDAALPHDEKALAMRGRLYAGRNHPLLALSLNNIGGTLEELGQHEEALDRYRAALTMRRGLFEGDHPAFTVSLNNIAHVLTRLERTQEAIPHLQEALAMCRRLFEGDHPDTARALNNLGMAYGTLGRTEEAFEAWSLAAGMGKRIAWSRRHIPLVALGRHHLAAGDAEAAQVPLAAAIEHVEARRRQARGLQAQGQARFASAIRGEADPYPVMVAAQVSAGHADEALAYLERGRARSVLDLLERGRHTPLAEALARAEAAGDQGRHEELVRVQKAVRAAESALVRAESAAERAGGRKSLSERRAALAAVTKARQALDDTLRARLHALRSSLPEASPLTAVEIQGLLAPQERMLAYALGKRASYVFLVRPGGMAIEAFRLTQGDAPVTPDRVRGIVERFLARLEAPDASPAALEQHPGHELFDLLVPRRVWAEIRAASRVYVLPHGALHQVPFEALVTGRNGQELVYWVDQAPPTAYVPSGSVLAWLRARSLERAGHGEGAVVALGDPVFGESQAARWPSEGVLLRSVDAAGTAARAGLRPGDVIVGVDGATIADGAALRAGLTAAKGRAEVVLRIDRGEAPFQVRLPSGPLGVRIASEAPPEAGAKLLARGAPGVEVQRALGRHARLPSLPGTRSEVKAIADLYREAGRRAEVRVLLGRDASEARLYEAAEDARVLHIATHGLAEENGSASFSALALTRPRVPVPGDDGFLTLADLLARWRARLQTAELVVLSACESHRGRLEHEEGMLSLPLGFCFAGCPRVVGSLWRVDDATTAQLMTNFHRHWREAPASSVASALQRARQAVKASHPDPYYWAPFVLLGDAR